MIYHNCKLIKCERTIDLNNRPDSDFMFIPCSDPARIREMVVEYMTDKLPQEYGFVPCVTSLRSRAQGRW
jgi:hypothetical protein